MIFDFTIPKSTTLFVDFLGSLTRLSKKNIKPDCIESTVNGSNCLNSFFKLTKSFPKEEKYSLVDQIIRSSRSVAINIREGYAKRHYEQVFIRHLVDAIGSKEETRGWLDFALKCNYIDLVTCNKINSEYDEIGAMLHTLIKNWKTF